MKVEIDVDDVKLQNLSNNAYSKLQAISKKHAEDILEEASRLEVTRNSSGNNPEITAQLIEDAVDYVNKFRKLEKPKKKKVSISAALQALSFITSTLAGSLFDVDKFKEANNVYWFMSVFTLAVILNVVVFFNDNQNE